jgi:transcriptional regulator with XRE-family HTH domain
MKRMTLKAARLARQWTQDQLAAESGVSQASIVKYERDADADPAVSVVDKLENALGLRRGTLIFGRQQQRRAS